MHHLAQLLNEILQKSCIYNFLSEKGINIFFPKEGILGQAAEARGKKINATIGIALDEDGSPLRLPCIEEKCKLGVKDIFPYASSYGKN